MRSKIIIAREQRIAAREKKKEERATGGKEFGKNWYNSIYSQATRGEGEYAKEPENCMYKDLWFSALGWIRKVQRIYDLGCGPGQFVQLALKNGYRVVKAVDFSETAISLAKKRCLKHAQIFNVGDLKTSRVYAFLNYDIITAFEVFEHIQNDIFILRSIPVKKHIIFSVPNYGYRSHVRFFPKFRDVYSRYERYITIHKHKEIVIDKIENKIIWLLYGIRR
jgi:2-polyprenyl-3-methyl-5-hydroxy-6-metoxy-1,4-benzoquinol methylase